MLFLLEGIFGSVWDRKISAVQFNNINSSVFGAIGDPERLNEEVSVFEEQFCFFTRATAISHAANLQRLEISSATEHGQAAVVCNLFSASTRAPALNPDDIEALLVEVANHEQKTHKRGRAREDELMAVKIVDRFCVDLFVDGEQGGTELGHGVSVHSSAIRHLAQSSAGNRNMHVVGIDESHLIDHVTKLWWQIEKAEVLLLPRLGSLLSLLLERRFRSLL